MLGALGGNGQALAVASIDSVGRSLLSACRFAFDWDDERFACSNTMGISNLSLSLSHEYHHPHSLQLTNGKEGSKQHFLESIEEADKAPHIHRSTADNRIIVGVMAFKKFYYVHKYYYFEELRT
jgi:hypothetical protein